MFLQSGYTISGDAPFELENLRFIPQHGIAFLSLHHVRARAAPRPTDRVFLLFAFAGPAPLSPRGLLTYYVSRYLKYSLLVPSTACSPL